MQRTEICRRWSPDRSSMRCYCRFWVSQKERGFFVRFPFSQTSDIGKVVVQVAKERNLQTISIIKDKPGSPDIIEELKALGGDIVVPESYTKTWYMKRLAGELRPSAGLNFSDRYQATAVGKAVTSGGTFVTYGKKLPKYVSYDGAAQRPVEWDAFIKEKNLKVLNF